MRRETRRGKKEEEIGEQKKRERRGREKERNRER